MNNLPPSLKEITNVEELNSLKNDLSTILEFDKKNIRLIKKLNWIAVPQESASHLTISDIKNLSQRLDAQEKLYAYAIENIKPEAFEVLPTLEGLYDFSNTVGSLNYVLFPEHLSWIIICSTDDYYIVAGSEQFISAVLGNNLEESFKNFKIYANSPQFENWPQISEFLNNLYVKLYVEYPQLKNDTYMELY